MQVDALAIVLRPRSMAEATDLGVRVVQRHWRSIWAVYAPLLAGTTLLAMLTVELQPWLPAFLLFWLKPWLDRSLLFVLSRAVFGQDTRWRDLAAQRAGVWRGQWLQTLTWRRLSPWRSYTQAIGQLEGQRGKARARRRDQLLHGRRGIASAMHFVFANGEMLLSFGLLAVMFWFTPEAARRGLWSWLLEGSTIGINLLFAGAYALVLLVLEPFYVAAGFAMYLNRRVELEAWDVEQEFRRAFAH